MNFSLNILIDFVLMKKECIEESYGVYLKENENSMLNKVRYID